MRKRIGICVPERRHLRCVLSVFMYRYRYHSGSLAVTEAVTGRERKSLKRLPGGNSAAFSGLAGKPSADFNPARALPER